ncbi:hypothetical protein CC86DRAFT_113313 [Ophiobolus disseminans]|uniref:Uncharacterized protein n=1 Tax=Ophiobolus disseminans TaxID=1469910 RepID=A0A6A6ZIX1_9PLEO|nr:hypothetical protein CC86DRAFT_113313 [Ophiobolus disseminans]
MYSRWFDLELPSRRRFRCSGCGRSGKIDGSISNQSRTRAAVSSIFGEVGREEGMLARVGESWAMRGWTRRRMQVELARTASAWLARRCEARGQ